MTVRLEDGEIYLEGRCQAADAETLLLALQDAPGATVDVSGITKLHLAVAQLLLALRPTIRGKPDVPFLAQNIFD